MSGPVLLVEDIGPIRRLTLNRPEKLNALDSALVQGLSEELGIAGEDVEVKVIVLAGPVARSAPATTSPRNWRRRTPWTVSPTASIDCSSSSTTPGRSSLRCMATVSPAGAI